MYLRSHAQKYIPGVYLHVCKLYTRVNLAHANGTLDVFIPYYTVLACFKSATWLKLITAMQEKTKIFTFFSYEIKTPTPVEVAYIYTIEKTYQDSLICIPS